MGLTDGSGAEHADLALPHEITGSVARHYCLCRAGCWVLAAGCWVLGAGRWMLDAGCGREEMRRYLRSRRLTDLGGGRRDEVGE